MFNAINTRNIFNSFKLIVLTVCVSICCAACSNEDAPVVEKAVDLKQKAETPFSYYKKLEIKPGYNFEIVGWGRGVDSIGGALILMSDSVKNNYKSVAIDREGIITDAFNLDLDNDGNPEIYLQTLVRKNVSDLTVYEFGNGSFSKISFPGISAQKGYKGNDQFYVKNGDLLRKIPLESEENGKMVTTVKVVKYRLSGNTFSATEVKPE